MLKVAIDGVTCDTSMVEANGRLVPFCRYDPDQCILCGLAAAVDFLQAFGRHLHSLGSSNSQP